MVKLRVEERFHRARSDEISKSFSTRKKNARRKVNRGSAWKLIDKRSKNSRKLYNHFKRRWDKYLSVCVHVFALVVLGLMIVEETNNYQSKPTGTAVDDDMYPVQKIPFPGIAICSFNIIDRKRAEIFAADLYDRNAVKKLPNVTVEKITRLLAYMGHFISFSSWENEPGDFELLHKILKISWGNKYNVAKVMERVMLPCRRVLEYCSWGGEVRSCEELFIPRWTQDGLCCTFNYVRWTDDISTDGKTDFASQIEKTKYSGFEYGLRVFIDPTNETKLYTSLAADGYKVMVFNPTDYPDSTSGGLKDVLISPGVDHHLKIKGTYFHSSPEVVAHPTSKRMCLFSSELNKDFGGAYSYSQCIMLCRARDIMKTCGCIPLHYPYPKDAESTDDCTVMNLRCMYRNRNRWWSIKPIMDNIKNPWDGDDTNNNLECDCLPNCEGVDYAVFHTGSEIKERDITLIDFLRNYSRRKVSNTTILISISFETPTIVTLKQDVLYYWYDLMSTYGGLCSMFLGISILTPIELIWEFLSTRWEAGKKSHKAVADSGNPEALINSKKLEVSPIYWQEIWQQSLGRVQN